MRRVIKTIRSLLPPRGAPHLAVMLVALCSFSMTAPAADAATVNSLKLRASYDVSAKFNWTTRHVEVRTESAVHNPTGSSVSTIAFNLATLRYGQAHVGVVTVNGAAVSETIQDQTVLVPISPPMPAGGNRTVVINYTGTLQTRSDGDYWQFARLGGYMTAYRWIPWLSRTVKFDRPSVGEVWVTPTASRVDVTITTDQVLKMATSGERTSPVGLTQTFVAYNVRDFNFSAAPDYLTASRTAAGGKTITFFYKSMNATKVLNWAVTAFNTYSNNVGAYPYDQLNIAEVGPWAGIESPSLFWLPNDLPGKYLPWTTAHEVAHQWFYSVVGNDQALEPFADEAVSDFMARKLVNSWANSQCSKSRLDITVYTKPGKCYPWIVYVQGNRYLKAYFEHVGAADFWQGLHNYYAAYKFGIGGTRQLLDALDAASNYHPNHAARFPTLYP
ncbi:MAG: hypothetical protein ABI797_03945 [Chloroflexota bacterium]